jgi:dTDP-4-amino-4,6-dideoxygalactose transaminase
MTTTLPKVAPVAGAAATHFVPIARPLIGKEEQDAVMQVLSSGALVQGKFVAEFERQFAEYTGVKHAIAVCNGTLALWLALQAHGIGPGDEVITSPFSFIASANAVLYVGAQPVFADIDPRSYTLDPESVKARITPRTRAILPVHLYGGMAHMDALMPLAQQHKLVVIEDACQAHGAMLNGKRAGSFGTGAFSFYPTKNMTSGEGGIITTNDDQVAEQARLLRNHGQSEKYVHDIVGYNFRMTELQGAIGAVQVKYLDEWTDQRVANANYLMARLHGLTLPHVPSNMCHVFHQFTVRVPAEKRTHFIECLADQGIGSAIHYPRPIHKQPAFQKLGYDDALPVAEQAAQEVVSLPVHPALNQNDLERIDGAVHRALEM